MATLDVALEQIKPGGSISQVIWTRDPQTIGMEPEAGIEYQIKVTITMQEGGLYHISGELLATRPIQEKG